MAITIIIFFILFMADQVSKYFTEILLVENQAAVPLFGDLNFLRVTKIYNQGAAWGMLEDNTIILVVISALATILLAFFASKNDWKANKFGSFTLTLALAGCVGNFFDRFISVIPQLQVYRKGVVDMIQFEPFDALCRMLHLGTTTFNVADSFLVVGLILYAIDLIFFDERKKLKYAKNHN